MFKRSNLQVKGLEWMISGSTMATKMMGAMFTIRLPRNLQALEVAEYIN
jgi:hypothetical protein